MGWPKGLCTFGDGLSLAGRLTRPVVSSSPLPGKPVEKILDLLALDRSRPRMDGDTFARMRVVDVGKVAARAELTDANP